MSAMASQITSLTIVNSTVYSGTDQRKHQSSAPLDFGKGINRWAVNSLHKGPVTLKNVSIWWRHHVYVSFPVLFETAAAVEGTTDREYPFGRTMIITMTSYWARWHLKSPASRLFSQPFIQGSLWPVTGEFPSQMTSNAENVSIWWRHHDLTLVTLSLFGGKHTTIHMHFLKYIWIS